MCGIVKWFEEVWLLVEDFFVILLCMSEVLYLF